MSQLSLEQIVQYWNKQVGDKFYTQVVLNEDEIIGFICAGKARLKQFPISGEIYALYVRRDNHYKGVGSELMFRAFQWLYTEKYLKAIVVVLDLNPSKKFYLHTSGKQIDIIFRNYGEHVYEEAVLEFSIPLYIQQYVQRRRPID